MKKQYYWLSMARPKAGGGHEFAGVVILPLKAIDFNHAIAQAQEQGHVPEGVTCKGGPLQANVVPPQDYVGRVLSEEEARQAMALLNKAAGAA